MKLIVVFDRQGKNPLRDRENEYVVLPSFRWYALVRGEGSWQLHLLAFCSATTEDFKFQQYRGVVTLGWRNGPVLEFSPGTHIFQLLKGGK